MRGGARIKFGVSRKRKPNENVSQSSPCVCIMYYSVALESQHLLTPLLSLIISTSRGLIYGNIGDINPHIIFGLGRLVASSQESTIDRTSPTRSSQVRIYEHLIRTMVAVGATSFDTALTALERKYPRCRFDRSGVHPQRCPAASRGCRSGPPKNPLQTDRRASNLAGLGTEFAQEGLSAFRLDSSTVDDISAFPARLCQCWGLDYQPDES